MGLLTLVGMPFGCCDMDEDVDEEEEASSFRFEEAGGRVVFLAPFAS